MKLITANLVDELKQLTKPAEHISWITAFTMESGVKEVLDVIQRLKVMLYSQLCLLQHIQIPRCTCLSLI